MKKSLFMLGVAVAALASCTNEEVMDVAQNRAIGFDSFVNNNTRAVVTGIDGTSLSKFYVTGYHTNTIPVYENFVEVTKIAPEETEDSKVLWQTNGQTAYWQATKVYDFAAYSDGNNDLSDGVTADFTVESPNPKLEIVGYTPDNSKDLIAAISDQITCTDPSTQKAVGLSFKHLLSQVKFTFTNTDTDAYTLKISDIQIKNAIKVGNGVLTGRGATAETDWTGDLTGADVVAYTFDEIADIADVASEYSTDCLVIPQENADLEVIFTATLWDDATTEDNPLKKGSFVASLNTNNVAVWSPGFRYNYKAEINGDDIVDPDNPEEFYPIKFTVDIDSWDDAADYTPDVNAKN